MPKNYLTVRAAANAAEENEILVHGPIGDTYWDSNGVTGKAFTDALNKFPRGTKVTIGVNSQGGQVNEGLAIYHAIKRRAEDITVRIDGYAVSIASVFPLAASKVISPKSAIWMIHKAANMSYGNEDDKIKDAAMLRGHDNSIVTTYTESANARNVSKTADQFREAMAAETWMSGEDAIAWGLADETDDKDVTDALNEFDFSKAPQGTFKNVPANFMAMASFKNLPAAKGGAGTTNQNKPNNPPAASHGGANAPIMKKENIVALLKTHGIDASVDETIEALEKKLTEALAKKTEQPKPAASGDDDTKAQLKDIKAQLEKERGNRIARAIDQHIVDGRMTTDEREDATKRAVADETYLDVIAKRPQNLPGAAPIGFSANGESNGGRDTVMKLKKGAARYNFLKENWSELKASGYRGTRSGVVAANTTDAALVTDMLLEGATTVLQNRLAPLRVFSKEVSQDRVKPLAVLQHRKITAGGTAQTNATNFEDTTNFVGTEDNVAITMAQITAGGHVTNAERQSGVTMSQWVDIKTAEIADKIMALHAAKILEGTFTATPVVSAAESFGGNELAKLWGQLKKSPIKNIILDGEYFAQFLPSDRFDFAETEYRNRGWDNFVMNTVWTGATANTVGFACNPQALVTGLGLPLRDPNANLVSTETILQLPELGVSVAVYQWYSNITRASWTTYDIMVGVAADDVTAGVLIKSA